MRLVRVAAMTAMTAALAWSVAGCGGDDPATSPVRPRIVASTSWVGAIAKAAGATDIRVIAPAGRPDPAYRPTAADLAPIADADLVLFAESDGFAGEIKAAAGKGRLVAVRPTTAPAELAVETTRLAGLFGTPRATETWMAGYAKEYAKLSRGLKASLPSPAPTVVAEGATVSWAEFAGLRVTGRPATKPTLVLADAARPDAAPRIDGVQRVAIVTYPTADLDLVGVLRANAAALTAALSA